MICATLSNALTLSGPYVINGILGYLQLKPTELKPIISRELAFGLAGILTFCYLLKSVLLQHALNLVNHCGIISSNILTTCLYDKILKLSQSSLKYNSAGNLITLFSVDIKTVEMFFQLSTFLASAPFMIVVCTALIIVEV